MAESIDEAMLIAWVDGELDAADAERVARAVSADPDLAAMGDRHRAMKARFAAAFGPIADEPVAMPAPASAPVISLAAARADREARAATRPVQRWWGLGGAVAASLLVGVLFGHGVGGPAGVADNPTRWRSRAQSPRRSTASYQATRARYRWRFRSRIAKATSAAASKARASPASPVAAMAAGGCAMRRPHRLSRPTIAWPAATRTRCASSNRSSRAIRSIITTN